MARYKSGTIAIATVRGIPGVKVMRRGDVWLSENGLVFYRDQAVTDVRLQAVLDPNDRRQIAELLRDYYTQPGEVVRARSVDNMQVALCKFADANACFPEPTGLGAVVRDSDGRRWTRANDAGEWYSEDGNDIETDFTQIDVVEKLSDGAAWAGDENYE